MGSKLDLTGKKFGSLVGIKEVPDRDHLRRIFWTFKCDCGKISTHVGHRVASGHIKSCGCSRKAKDAQVSGLKAHYTMYRYNAKTRGLSFSINKKDFKRLCDGDCHYCDSPPESRNRKTFKARLNGLDRIRSDKGYSLRNCVPCCSTCNRLKGDLDVKTFMSYIFKIAKKWSLE